MLPAVVKNKIEQIWLDVIAGGVSQPTEVIEQLTYLMFAKQLDEREADIETAELLSGEPQKHIFGDSKEEQALYDKAHISRDIGNQCFMWAIIMLAGALLSCFLTPYIAIPTYIIWLVLFFREVHFDNHKAFEKYLLK